MVTLTDYLKEELFSTPMNTMGMGNITFPSMDNSQVGSGDVLVTDEPKRKKKKKFKRYKI